MVVEGAPSLEFRVLAALQDVLLALEVWVVETHKGAALHSHRVDAVDQATFLEVVAAA